MSLRNLLAVNAAKLVRIACRLAGRQGTALAGQAAMTISPAVTHDLASQVRHKVIVVCGTNGKTSTNNLLCAALEAEGRKVVCNRLGANMPTGIAATLTASASPLGHLDADYACLEVDEASSVRLFGALQPDYMILTNLFRDQLDRYGEIDHTMDLLEQAIRQVPGMKLVVNGDDPLCTYLAMKSGNPYITFGIAEPAEYLSGRPLKGNDPAGSTGSGLAENNTTDNSRGKAAAAEPSPASGTASAAEPSPASGTAVSSRSEIREGRFCKRCGAPLDYDFFHYGQMGHYHCSRCDFRRPVLSYEARDVQCGQMISFDLTGKVSAKSAEHFDTSFRGLYHLYNILAVWSVLQEDARQVRQVSQGDVSPDSLRAMSQEKRPLDSRTDAFRRALQNYRPQFGRSEIFHFADRRVLLNLAKNPTGFNQNITAMLQDPEPKDLVIVINDNAQDGVDVSWLWDVDFDRLSDTSVREITVSGIRALDMQLRLKYAGISAKVSPTPEEAIRKYLDRKQVPEKDPEILYVLVNYSALMPIHLYLRKECKNSRPEKHNRNA